MFFEKNHYTCRSHFLPPPPTPFPFTLIGLYFQPLSHPLHFATALTLYMTSELLIKIHGIQFIWIRVSKWYRLSYTSVHLLLFAIKLTVGKKKSVDSLRHAFCGGEEEEAGERTAKGINIFLSVWYWWGEARWKWWSWFSEMGSFVFDIYSIKCFSCRFYINDMLCVSIPTGAVSCRSFTNFIEAKYEVINFLLKGFFQTLWPWDTGDNR